MFFPERIYVDSSVQDLPLTQRILKKFPRVSAEVLTDPQIIKKTVKQKGDMTPAKKKLLLGRLRSDPLKEFQAMTRSISGSASQGETSFAPTKNYYSLDLISNCHLECTYCILQSYLENNPVLTIYTNIEEVLDGLRQALAQVAAGSIIGTGKIADSLALDNISEHTQYLVPFFAQFKNIFLELKTKSDQVDSLLPLHHEGRTVVSWSLNPDEVIRNEEYKTASLAERLSAAARVTEAGYRVAFHFDPLIWHEGWKENYTRTVDFLFSRISASSIAWVSVGTLRFPARQLKTAQKRFPRNQTLGRKLISTHQKFLHYPDELREEMHEWMETHLKKYVSQERIYRCMDFQ